MTQQTQLSVQPRVVTGKKVYNLRKQGLVPGHIFSGGTDSILVQAPLSTVTKLYQDVGETGLVTLLVEGSKKTHPVLIDEVQVNPVTGEVITVSFKEVNLKEKIKADIPVEITGELSVIDATVNVLFETIEVEALPADLPENFTIDISEFTEIGQSVTFAQLEYDKSKVSLEVTEEQMSEPVVMVQASKEMAEPEEETPTEAEVVGAEEAAPETEKTEE